MTSVIQKLNRNPIFKFASSIRLAVPLMLLMAFAVSYGTISESRYSAEMARLEVYQATWFQILLGFLWLNIFCATLSRIPFKKHHTGFVITHIGLLTLLIGAMVTSEYGIDGQLRVVEGSKNNIIFLQDLALSVRAMDSNFGRDFAVTKSMFEKKKDHFKKINVEIGDIFQVNRYLPFINSSRMYRETQDTNAGIGLGFIMKSQFFNVSEWLHTKDNPEMKMGPATIRILTSQDKPTIAAKKAPATSSKKATSSGAKLIVISAADGKTLATLDAAAVKAKTHTIQNVEFQIKNIFRQAVVAKGGLAEGAGDNANPAIELDVRSQGKSLREVSYARFPDFSLNAKGTFGLKFQFTADENSGGHTENESLGQEVGATGSRLGNVVEFYVSKENLQEVTVELYKNNVKVMAQKAKSGTTIQTPWMGMTIGVGSILANAEMNEEVSAIEPPLRSDLPPSALYILPTGADESHGFWVKEGDVKTFNSRGKSYEIYFGRKSFNLPFIVNLQKFSKVDYPGTETPMSFESDVHINDTQLPIKISMNEPYKKDGFTLYQSSYEMNPGGPAASIFSVNQDPGRPIKYAGSLILSIGIIVFTLMRSRVGRQSKQ